MFGDKNIIGESYGKIDNKERILIPSFANPEVGDEIILRKVKMENEVALELSAYKKYLILLEKIKTLRDTKSKSIEEFLKYDSKIKKICNTLEFLVKTDKQKRIHIPKILLNEVNMTNNDPIVFIGSGSSLIIKKR